MGFIYGYLDYLETEEVVTVGTLDIYFLKVIVDS